MKQLHFILGSVGRDDRGVAAVELALILPVIVLVFFGIVETSRIISASKKLYSASWAMSELVARTSNPSGLDLVNICNGSKQAMRPFAFSTVGISFAEVTNQSGTPTVTWEDDTTCNNGGPKAPIADAATLASPYVPYASDAVIIAQARFQYVDLFGVSGLTAYFLPPNNSRTIALTQTTFARARYNSGVAWVSRP